MTSIPTRFPTVLLPLALALSTAGAASGLVAQDRFGQAVAAAGGEVMVLKPGAGRGPAAVYVYRPGPGGWELAQRLRPAGADETGEGYSGSLARAGETLWIGSGDPDVRWAAHRFRRTGGKWVFAERLALEPERPPAPRSGPLDLAGVMRILQPPERVVALAGDRAVVAALGGVEAGVRILEARPGEGEWTVAGRAQAGGAGPDRRVGASLAVSEDRAFIGAPGHGVGGAVFVFQREEGGTWGPAATLEVGDGVTDAALGSALVADGERIVVGAPGSGEVVVFGPSGGGWSEVARLTSPEGGTDGFGSSLALHADELWVGAPDAAGGRGAVHRFRRDAPAGTWEPHEAGPVTSPAEGGAFGTSVALAEAVAVAGAPLADGGLGRAAVFGREADGAWSEPEWLGVGGELTAVTGGEVACAGGRAAGFPCDNVDLLAFLPVDAIGGEPGEGVSDVWGWTDPQTGREYALVGRTGGAALVDVSDPANPVYRGVVTANPSGARDLKVYRDHLFFTGDGAGDHGLVIFDLTRLRDDAAAPREFEPDTVYRGIASAHNLVLDPEAGFAYPVGASGGGESCGGGLHMVDVREPLEPTFAGCYTDTEGLLWAGRTHDAQCVVYRGPDDAYRGRQICFASNETALRIVDVTDKETPVPLAAATYPRLSYVHQGWLTEDQRYFYQNDELDELTGQADRTRTLVWDVAELDDPVFVGEFSGSTAATDHNLYIRGNRMYQANYNAGMQVWDVSDPERPVEIGRFDTTPWEGDPPGFGGAWSAWPFLESGTVLVTSRGEGLFLLRPRTVFP